MQATARTIFLSAAILCLSACSSPLPKGYDWQETFDADKRVNIDSLSDAQRCALTEADVKENKAAPATETVFIDWKEAGIRMNLPWNPTWGTTKYKTGPWRYDGLQGAFGPLELATGPCPNLLISAYGVEKKKDSLLDLQKDPSHTNLKAYIVGTKKALRFDEGVVGGTAKSLATEVSGGTLVFYGQTEQDISIFETIVQTLDTTALGNL